MAALPPVPPLPDLVLERLNVLLRQPHDYPMDEWDQTVQRHGGSGAVLRLIAPELHRRNAARHFEGARKGDFLSGVSLGWSVTRATCEVVDASGSMWTVRSVEKGVVHKRRAAVWERADEALVAKLLRRVVELALR